MSNDASENTLHQLMQQSAFRTFWLGESISLLGDQFYYIALPWLVLNLTDDALAVGLVMALIVIPRALFMIVGGVVTDWLSPLNVMILANGIRMILVTLLAIFVISSRLELWMVYLFALLYGTTEAFFVPAQNSMVPNLVEDKDLQSANTLVQSVTQLAGIIGPVIAGLLIAIEISYRSLTLNGIALALLVDSLSFVISIVSLFRFRLLKRHSTAVHRRNNPLLAFREAWHFVRQDKPVRTVFIVVAIYSFLMQGPFYVGMPILANNHFGGAISYGLILAFLGIGSLIGMVFANRYPNPIPHRRGLLLLILTAS